MRLKLLALFILATIGLAGCDISPEDHRSQIQPQAEDKENLAGTIAMRVDSQPMQKRFPA